MKGRLWTGVVLPSLAVLFNSGMFAINVAQGNFALAGLSGFLAYFTYFMTRKNIKKELRCYFFKKTMDGLVKEPVKVIAWDGRQFYGNILGLAESIPILDNKCVTNNSIGLQRVEFDIFCFKSLDSKIHYIRYDDTGTMMFDNVMDMYTGITLSKIVRASDGEFVAEAI